ncbi:MAG: MmgE/PrpD family protein [Candidatus Bathyarchaeia archaeon]
MIENLDLSIAEYIVNTDYSMIPKGVIEVAKKSMLDTIGVILAGSTLGEGREGFVRFAKEWGEGESTVLGFGFKTSPPMAAFANGSMAHALDYEEAHDGALVHPSAQSLPTILAISEAVGGVSGEDFITALILGNELTVRLGLALTCNPLELGWYPPPILGAFGATAAGCKVLDLNERELLSALSLMLCQTACSAEIIHSPKSIIRAVRDAFPSMASVVSAMLAKNGVTGFERPITGKGGFFKMYADGNYQPSVLTKDLGKNFEYADVSLKAWPSCRGTHSLIQAAITLAEENIASCEEIENIHLVVGPVNRMLCEPLESKKAPKTIIDAKFSLPFTVATAFINKRVGLDSFSEEKLLSREVLSLAKKITYEVDTSYRPTEGRMIIKTKDGKAYSKKVNSNELYGSPSNPLTKEFLIDKFTECSKYSALKLCEGTVKELVELILNIENVSDVREITSILYGQNP